MKKTITSCSSTRLLESEFDDIEEARVFVSAPFPAPAPPPTICVNSEPNDHDDGASVGEAEEEEAAEEDEAAEEEEIEDAE